MTRPSSHEFPSLRPPAMPLPPLPPPPPPPSGRRARRMVLMTPSFDHVEDVTQYRPGGYHPVTLGDVIGQRYRILRKLGHGGFAIVWLARDLHEGLNVAVKILRSDCTQNEAKYLEYLRERAPQLPITHLRKKFTIHGVNGYHQCLVLDLGGPTLHQLAIYSMRRPPPALSFRKVTAHWLASSLARMHEAGVCHGDLTSSNVIFEVEGLRNWTEPELNQHLGSPTIEPLLYVDGSPAMAHAPAQVVESLDYSRLDIAKLCLRLLITDFGEAFFTDDPPKDLGTPAAFVAPELWFGYFPSPAVDLWALGCLLYEIHTFGMFIPALWGQPDEAIAMAVETIGPLPKEWRSLYYQHEVDRDRPGKYDWWYDGTVQLKHPLHSQIHRDLPNLSQTQLAGVVRLVETVLVFEPSHRRSAQEVSMHPWFTDRERNS